MQVIAPSFEITRPTDWSDIAAHVERCGRVCYKSEDRITPTSAARFIKRILDSQHESVVEHVGITVHFVTDRGVSHQLVRHRLASYSQESTRYCNYGKSGAVRFVEPIFVGGDVAAKRALWFDAMACAERYYLALLAAGAPPDEARSVLPVSTKTEVVMTANLREWRHVFKERCSKRAHREMRRIMVPLAHEFARRCPVLFDAWLTASIAEE